MRDWEIKIIFDLPSYPRNQKANPSSEGTICPISFVKDVLVSWALLLFLSVDVLRTVVLPFTHGAF